MSLPRIAIIEDEFLVALQLEDIVLDAGFQVVASVPDKIGADGITLAPDVALVDLNLRDGPTGPAIARQLSERFGTRIIYVTANSGQIGLPAETAIGVVHKPFSRDAIEFALAYALDDTLVVPRPAELHLLDNHTMRQSA